MGGRKFEISRLTKIRKSIVGVLKNNSFFTNDDNKFSCQLCFDWDEFNKLYFSKRHSVIQCPMISNRCEYGVNAISLYIAMKMAFGLKKVNVITDNFTSLEYQINEFYYSIDPTKDIGGKNKRLSSFLLYSLPSLNYICNCDELVLIPFSYIRSSHSTMDYIDSKRLLNFIDSTLNEKITQRGIKLTILAHDIRVNDECEVFYDELKKRFPDFLYFDYTNEKKFVDDWFESNDTLIDPEFDIKVTDPELDKKKVWRYISTNHKYKFREYCKFDKEFVMKNMPMKELKEYGIF